MEVGLCVDEDFEVAEVLFDLWVGVVLFAE